MAVFIPEWVRVSGPERQLKRVFQALGDAFVVRRPLGKGGVAPQLFVERRGGGGWLAVVIEERDFAALRAGELFVSEERTRLEHRLWELCQALAQRVAAGDSLRTLCVLWACSAREARSIAAACAGAESVDFIARDEFMDRGAEWIAERIRPASPETCARVLAAYFPETEIHSACAARRGRSPDAGAELDRHFLDPDQEWAFKLDLELPEDRREVSENGSVRLVNGVAGSGKTLIAVHRARWFAERCARDRVLLLIHNTPIVADLRVQLQRAGRRLPPNVFLGTFFAWVTQRWEALFGERPTMPGRRALQELIRDRRARLPGLRLSDAQIADELDFINEMLIRDEAAYLAVQRVGRGFSLHRESERPQLWKIYEDVTRALGRAGLRLWSALPREVALAAPEAARSGRYRHVIVDEAQFFAPSWFQVIKRSLEPEGQLFLCADPNQGFLKHRLSWKSAGLDVAGRTKRLRRSYRTTRALLEAASGVLAALGHCGDEEDFLWPDFEGMEAGSPPHLLYCGPRQEGMDRVVRAIDTVHRQRGRPLRAMLVICGDVDRPSLYRKLCRSLGPERVWWLNEKNQKKRPPDGGAADHLRMASLDTATGLEAELVFLLGMEPLLYTPEELGEEERAAQKEARMRKLYMALTRASRTLVLVSSDRLPPALERLFRLGPEPGAPPDSGHGAGAAELAPGRLLRGVAAS